MDNLFPPARPNPATRVDRLIRSGIQLARAERLLQRFLRTGPANDCPPQCSIMKGRRHRLLYHVVPKVGCTLLRSMMLESEGVPTRSMIDMEIAKTADSYMLFSDSTQLPWYRGYRRFGFVRNPWARLVSCYRNKILGGVEDVRFAADTNQPFIFAVEASSRPFQSVDLTTMDFPDFVRFVHGLNEADSDIHFRSQYCFCLVCRWIFSVATRI